MDTITTLLPADPPAVEFGSVSSAPDSSLWSDLPASGPFAFFLMARPEGSPYPGRPLIVTVSGRSISATGPGLGTIPYPLLRVAAVLLAGMGPARRPVHGRVALEATLTIRAETWTFSARPDDRPV